MHEHVRQEFQSLLDEYSWIAKKMLAEDLEFCPYGAAISISGDLVSVSAVGIDDVTRPSEMRQWLIDHMREQAQAGQYRATAVFYDSKTVSHDDNSSSDAIAIELDHVDGYPVLIFEPYQVKDGHLDYANLGMCEGQTSIFQRTQQ
ncbi:hypothetical protein [Erythrobacter ani]|uniref:Uncharacterized protein n=1 Tax=Erythrobacter ani TaxID=2827235 RepID=A0ABS6SM69_9SPHN|nr:hypothetical protein [Erythrobacter ani]MBV7266082.1 hypothetical protein [Erythrobacter ani]